MVMFHHDSRDLNSAVNEAREMMRANLMRGAQRATAGLRTLQDRVIQDTLMPLDKVQFGLASNGTLAVNGQGITTQALGQLCTRTQLPVGFARKLLEHESPLVRNLAIENLETLSAVSDQTVMLRSVGGIYHGVVSDAYKRMDSNLLVGSFGGALQSAQLMPVACDLSATRIYVKALLPRLYGEQFGEALAFGIELRASDFGFGRVELNPFCDRVWCSNKAKMTLRMGKGFSKQHRGARLTEETFQLSAATQELQAHAMASELTDGVKGLLSAESIESYVNAIGACFAEGQRGGKFEAEKEIEKLVTARKLTDKVAAFVGDAYKSTDRNVVPAADGRWKLAQAVAYAAQWASDLDVDARADLEYLAGEIVESAPSGALLAAAN